MHWQRILLAGAAMAMATTAFLPIAREALADGNVTMMGTGSALTKTSAALGLILLVGSLLGRRNEKVGVLIWVFGLALGLYGACVGGFFYGWFTFELAPGTRQPMDAELMWPGLGVFVLIISSAVMLVVVLLTPFMSSRHANDLAETTPPAGESV